METTTEAPQTRISKAARAALAAIVTITVAPMFAFAAAVPTGIALSIVMGIDDSIVPTPVLIAAVIGFLVGVIAYSALAVRTMTWALPKGQRTVPSVVLFLAPIAIVFYSLILNHVAPLRNDPTLIVITWAPVAVLAVGLATLFTRPSQTAVEG